MGATSGKSPERDFKAEESMSQGVETETGVPQTDAQRDIDVEDFVMQCRMQARVLGERKLDQEQRLEALVESSFGQLEHILNSLLQAAQATHAAAHTQFTEASTQLEENLNRHEQVEAKLRAIMTILLGGSSQ